MTFVWPSWPTVKRHLQSAWAWCKKYWQIILGAAIPAVLWVITRSVDRRNRAENVLQSVNDAHRNELKAIEAAHEMEMIGIQEAENKHEQIVAQIREEHKAAEIALDEKKENRIREIVRRHKDDPDEITRRISALTGIRMMRR